MYSLHVKLLGGFEIRDGSGTPVGPLRRQSQAVLAVLALNPGLGLSRDKLAALLWSERGESQARGSLRRVLSDLRKALAGFDPPPLIADRDTVRIDSNAVEVDAVTFAHLIDENTPESLARAAVLYQGEFLDGLGVHDAIFEAWDRWRKGETIASISRDFQKLGLRLERKGRGAPKVTARKLRNRIWWLDSFIRAGRAAEAFSPSGRDNPPPDARKYRYARKKGSATGAGEGE